MKKLSLRQLSQTELEKREMNQLLGGGDPGTCRCGCGGPSGNNANFAANKSFGYTETSGPDTHCSCIIENNNQWVTFYGK